jgi:hypothetical protein
VHHDVDAAGHGRYDEPRTDVFAGQKRQRAQLALVAPSVT